MVNENRVVAPLSWSCDWRLQLQVGGGYMWFILPVVGQPLCLPTSSFHWTHGIPRHKPDLASNQEMSSVPSFPALEICYVIAWTGGAWTKTCATLCLCYPGFSEIRHKDVTTRSSPGKLSAVCECKRKPSVKRTSQCNSRDALRPIWRQEACQTEWTLSRNTSY